jgi:hypothetical protein
MADKRRFLMAADSNARSKQNAFDHGENKRGRTGFA